MPPEPRTLIDGEAAGCIDALDRGFLYGDGVFRTLRVTADGPLLWRRHAARLLADAAALGLESPEPSLLREETVRLARAHGPGVVRITLTPGAGGRGYARAVPSRAARAVSWFECPRRPAAWSTEGVAVRVCDLRLAEQPRLAGIKHLNRLEQVLARAEWSDPGIAEGLMLDAGGHAIEGTMSNLFVVEGGALVTPDLSRCGTAGIQRDRVIEWARRGAVPCSIDRLALGRVLAADEVFLVNSVIGLWPVRSLGPRRWEAFPAARRIAAALATDED